MIAWRYFVYNLLAAQEQQVPADLYLKKKKKNGLP